LINKTFNIQRKTNLNKLNILINYFEN